MTNKPRILVVDDDPNLRKTLSDILRIKGYEPLSAGSGAEAIAVAGQGGVSLALIDLMLPDMTGLEVMAKLKALSPLIEAIILTGHASMDTAIEATRRGAFSYLLKPYQMDDLLRNIKHGVERQQAQEEILRLASFPRLLPNPVIELDPAGQVTYLNPAAERLFPNLGAEGLSHALLEGSSELIASLWKKTGRGETSHEATLGDATYELHISHVAEVGLVRIYAFDITQRKRAEAEIQHLATTDSLTGIANRGAFSALLAKEVERAKRYGAPLALAMYDLDYFKRVNDTYGHDAGDYVLRAVSDLVRQSIRTTDIVARWGGEEFMVLMPHSDLQGAKCAAEKLRSAIAAHRFDKVGPLTASFGVAAFEAQDDVNTLLKRVDDALYRAKEQGRNRVETLGAEVAAS